MRPTLDTRNIIDMTDYPAAYDVMGRPTQKRMELRCPYCETRVIAYQWSLAGGGKRCPTCPDTLLTWGTAFRRA